MRRNNHVSPSNGESFNLLADEFVLGANYPWSTVGRAGHDFGPGTIRWHRGRQVDRDWSAINRRLAALKRDYRMKVFRWWILAGGVNYPVGEEPTDYGRWILETPNSALELGDAESAPDDPKLVARVQRAERRFVDHNAQLKRNSRPLPHLPASYVDDFICLLQACADAGVQLIPSFISFEWFQSRRTQSRGQTSRGRKHLVIGSEDEFLDATLEPLLRASRGFEDTIFAWEAINEPDWIVFDGEFHEDGAYLYARELNHFLESAVDRIHDAGFPSTIGFVKPNPDWVSGHLRAKLRDLAGEGLYIHQFHYYRTALHSHLVPDYDDLPVRPCFIGEFQTTMGREPPSSLPTSREELRAIADALGNLTWGEAGLAETDRSRYLYKRLELLDQVKGYPLVLLWGIESDDSKTDWSSNTQDQVRKYMNGQSP